MEENSETDEQKNTKSEEASLQDETPLVEENEEEANLADQDEQVLTPEGEKSPAENSDLRDRLLQALAENENLIRRGRRREKMQ